MNGPDSGGPESGERRGAVAPGQHHVELVGPHLRVRGRLSLGRFSRLVDLVNHNRGFIVLHEARLLEPTGLAMDLVLPELVVNQDEITFIGHGPEPEPRRDAVGEPDHGGALDRPGADRPGLDKQLRHFVIFTPGHAISGAMHVYREMTLANFVEASDPRFLPMSDATARSLADHRVVSRFELLLVNRTQINAIAETDRARELIEAVARADLDGGPPAEADGSADADRPPEVSPGSSRAAPRR